MIKRLLSLIIGIFFITMCATGQDYDFLENGIYYLKTSDTTASVSCKELRWDYHVNSMVADNDYTGHVVVPSTVTHIGTTYTVTGLGEQCFANCKGLTAVTLPPTITQIGSSAFLDSYNLNSVYITDLERWMNIDFNCVRLGEHLSAWMDLSCNPLYYAKNFYVNGELLTEVVYPEGITKITPAFVNHEPDKPVVLPNSVTEICQFAFYGWKMETFVIPQNVQKIEAGAFSECTNLKSLQVKAIVPPVLNGVYAYDASMGPFDDSNIKILVPMGCKEIYREKWPGFHYIEEGVLTESFTTEKNIVMQLGELYTVSTTVMPENTAFKTFSWTSSNPEVASIDKQGVVTAHSLGSTVIKGTTIDGTELSDSTTLTVTPSQYSLYVGNNSCFVGDTVTIAVALDNQMEVAGLQATLTIPEEFTFALNDNGTPDVTINADRSTNHVSNSNLVTPTTINIMAYSTTAEAFEGNTGEICYVKLLAKSTAVDGEHGIGFSNIIVSEPNGKRHQHQDVFSVVTTSSYVTGDVNGDRTINLEDVTAAANYSIQKKQIQFVYKACDINADNAIDVSDVALVSKIVKGEQIPTTGLFATNTKDNVITPTDASCTIGDTAVVSVSLNNADAITGFQTDIVIPDGFSLATNGLAINNARCVDHTIIYNMIKPNVARVMVYSPTTKAFVGNSGETFTVKLVADATTNKTLHTLLFNNTILSDTNGTRYTTEYVTSVITTSSYMYGDVNNDHKVDVADVLITANKAIGNEPAYFIFDAGDINKDNKIDVADVILIANIAIGKEVVTSSPRVGNNDDVMGIEDFIINSGETKTVNLLLDNTFGFAAFQLNLNLPEGLELINASLSDRATDGHSIMTHANNDGSISLLSFAASTENFEGNNGSILSLRLKANSDFNGEGTLELSDIILADSNGSKRDLNNVFSRVSGVSGVSDLANNTRVYASGRDIVIEIPQATTAQIVRINGMAQHVRLDAGTNTYNATDRGIYIVYIGGKSFKINVK